MIDLLTHHQNIYQQSLEFINSPPKGVKVMQIQPSLDLKSSMLGSSDDNINNDYILGIKAGTAFWHAHKNMAKTIQY